MTTPSAPTVPSGLNKRHRIIISQTVFWLMVVVNFGIRKIPVAPFDSALGIAGLGLLVSGALMRSWAAGYIRKAKALATTGPYALSRNPLYLGAAMILGGLICLVPDVLTAAALVVIFVALYYATIRSEEEFLRDRFGAQWDDYVARTSRFFPFRIGRAADLFVGGWSWRQWMENRGWGVYIGIGAVVWMLSLYQSHAS